MISALRIVATEPAEVSQAEREAAALENYYAAVKREDTDEAHRLWRVYAQVHAARPVEMVRAMERERGLC